MSCLRMEEAFSISSSSAKASKIGGFLVFEILQLHRLQAILNSHGEGT